jgi:hypothetical protein
MGMSFFLAYSARMILKRLNQTYRTAGKKKVRSSRTFSGMKIGKPDRNQ